MAGSGGAVTADGAGTGDSMGDMSEVVLVECWGKSVVIVVGRCVVCVKMS